MNPILSTQALTPLLLLIIGVGIFLSWRSTRHAGKLTRILLVALRSLSLAGICVLFFNPGKWVLPDDSSTKVWPILIDNSLSMAVEEGQSTRLESALAVHSILSDSADKAGAQIQTFSFGDRLSTPAAASEIHAKALASNLLQSGEELFSTLQASGQTPAGVIILSDGRQTQQSSDSHFLLHSKAHNAPIHTIAIGKKVDPVDLEITSTRPTVTGFIGQDIHLTATIRNLQISDQDIVLELLDSEEKVISKATVAVVKGEKTGHTFTLKAPELSTTVRLRIPILEAEQRDNNNQCDIYLRVLTTKTRVFIAEGAPYWDSKFLAQHLRLQPHIDVQSVHRINDSRFFKINSKKSYHTDSADDTFPDTAEDLAKFDLVIFGKNAEYFLTSKRIELLKSFVRDQGGAVLFSRGKSYSGKLPELADLEPVTWATGQLSQFSLLPTADGAASGLFGQALPGPSSTIWKSLPQLKDAQQIDTVKPFTRVLARGSIEGHQSTFPLLAVRRYGQGVTGMVNADGLWKWDFYPEARELGNMYSEFWSQLLQWMVAYSEFLPGYQYSLRSSASTLTQGKSITLTARYRGNENPEPPVLSIRYGSAPPQTLTPARVPSDDPIPTWKASYTPPSSGNYEITLLTPDKSPQPTALLQAIAPPKENDNLNPDSAFLSEIANSTNGQSLTAESFESYLDSAFSEIQSTTKKANAAWNPTWAHWLTATLLVLILGSEWFIRRRSGLS